MDYDHQDQIDEVFVEQDNDNDEDEEEDRDDCR